MAKRASFSKDWLTNPCFSSWIREVNGNKFVAFCNICHSTINLSNMGKQALTSHMKAKKHSLAIGSLSSNIKGFLVAPSKMIKDPSKMKEIPISVSSDSIDETNKIVEKEEKFKGMKSFLLKESITKAEIFWCLHIAFEHLSFRRAEKFASNFKFMFPDSEIATKMQLKRAKIGYTLVHGIAPVFKRDLLKELEACSYIVISFDESLNKISQKQQMDLNVRFWDEEKKEVSCRYLNSIFLGHSTALDLKNAFISGLMEVDLKKIIQVSMDGPNVNLKFLTNLRQELASSPVDPILLDIGSCGLHTLNCAFKAGMKATNWNLVEYLRALYNLFKDVPARRADYIQCTGSSIFAKKFCAIRWVENADVAQRALEILPNLKKYISYVDEQKQPKCKSFAIVAEHVHDPLIGAKLAFYQTLAEISEPFLKEFQGNSALAPFLYESLSLLSLSVATRFIKNDILDKYPLSKVDFSDSSIMKPSHGIDLGFAVRDVLKKTKQISDQRLLLFQQDCRKAFHIFIKKIMERSPLKYPLTKAISFLDPLVFVKEKIANSRLKSCLQILVSNNWLSGISADRIQQEFQHLHKNNEVNNIMKSYNKNEKRLDHHWINILEICKSSNELQNLVKFLCILSHGNAALERGFSVNKECIVENQSELSLIALRRIHDIILAAGGIEKIEINKKLIQAARNARSFYNEYLKQECNLERKRKDLSINKQKVQELQIKKMKLLSETKEKITSIDEEIIQLKK